MTDKTTFTGGTVFPVFKTGDFGMRMDFGSQAHAK